MDKSLTESEKLEYLVNNGWKIRDIENDNEEKQQMLEEGFPSLVISEICYSVDEAYRLQKFSEEDHTQ